MFENFDELMDETMDELQENETMEQDNVLENGNAEITPEEAESVGRGEYSPEARSHAWNEYNSLSGKEREAFLRGRSRNAHIMNMELRNVRKPEEEKESAGYSSDYYKHELATARNDIQRDYALRNYRAALARETVGSTTGEGEAAEVAEAPESVGYYSSDYYERRMATALETGNRTMYHNARRDWAEAKVRESVGSTTGEGEALDEAKEAVGSSPNFWLNKATKALAEGQKTAYEINMDRYYDALVKEAAGYKAEDGSIIEGPDPSRRPGREK